MSPKLRVNCFLPLTLFLDFAELEVDTRTVMCYGKDT